MKSNGALVQALDQCEDCPEHTGEDDKEEIKASVCMDCRQHDPSKLPPDLVLVFPPNAADGPWPESRDGVQYPQDLGSVSAFHRLTADAARKGAPDGA